MEIPRYESLQKYANYTFDDFIVPQLIYTSRSFMDVAFGLSLALYVFVIYVIVTQSSKAMGLFKYTIICQLTGNLMFDFYLFLWNPVYLFPLPAIGNYTPFPLQIEWVWYTAIIFTMAGIALGTTSLVYALGIRVYSVVFVSLGPLTKRKIFAFFASYGAIAVTITVSIAVPFSYCHTGDAEVKAIYFANLPVMTEIYQFLPLTTGFVWELHTECGNLFIGFMAAWIVIGFILFMVLHGIFLFKLKSFQKIVSKDTYNMQKMLYKILVIQLAILITVVLAPGSLIIIMAVFNLPGKKWTNLFQIIGSTYMIIDIISLLCFVKPYRIYVQSLVAKIYPNFGKGSPKTIVVSEARSISNVTIFFKK